MKQCAIVYLKNNWSDTPSIYQMQSIIIATAILLYTLFYKDTDSTATYVIATANIVADKVIRKYSSISLRIIQARNLICHYIGSSDCDKRCLLLLSQWSEVKALLIYLEVLPNVQAVLEEYYTKYNIPETMWDTEYCRLVELAGASDELDVAKFVKENLLQ